MPWSHRPPMPRHEHLAAARDVAIIAVCVTILAFALLALLDVPRDAPPPRRTAPAVQVST